ncbi:MAG: calcium/sodium antiporter [Myxococcota bacterium]
MIPWFDLLWLIVGFVGVTIGADVFVSGASGIAKRAGVSPLLIGLTIVALGTSAPEVAVNVTAAFRGQTDMAIGNVVGSNVLNVLGVLGLCALLRSIVVDAQLVRLDVPVMVGSALLLIVFARNGVVAPVEAAVLLTVLLVYTAIQIRLALKNRNRREDDDGEEGSSLVYCLAQIIFGVVLLVVGSDRLVLGATHLAKWWGLSDLVIGLTVIAVGTSLPEIATSVAATLRGQGELAVGNVVGSNIYNILAVVGLTGLVSEGGLPVSDAALAFDLPVMAATCFACLPIFLTEHRIDRWEGGLFVGFYLAYIAYLLLATQRHALADPFGLVMLYFVVPLTALTLAVLTFRYLRRKEPSPTA